MVDLVVTATIIMIVLTILMKPFGFDENDDKVGRRSEEFENLQQEQHHKAWKTFWGRWASSWCLA